VKTPSVNTIVQFKDEISIGDLVLVVPKKEDGSELAIGKVISAYLYDDYNIGYSHQRQVIWKKCLPTSVGCVLRTLTHPYLVNKGVSLL